MSGLRLSAWLVPEARQAPRIQAIVDYLAQRHAGPAFRAHLTVFAGTFEAEAPLHDHLAHAARRTPALTLRFCGVDRGSTFTRCLFARFEHHPVLTGLCESIRPLAQDPSAFRLDPHVSLYYGASEVAAEALPTVAFPFRTVRFDRLTLNHSPRRSTDPDDVEAWTQRAELPLVGS